jgi:integrase/recombinase XerC
MNAQADQSGHPGSKEGYAAAILEKYLRYLSDRKNRSALTLDSYSNDLDQFAAFLAESDNVGSSDPNTRLLGVDADTAARYVNSLVGRYTQSTLGRKITALRGLYAYLVSTEQLAANPFARVRIRPAGPASLEYLEESHLQQLFDAISGSHWLAFRDRAIVATLYSTGMRIGELLKLRIDDIDSTNAVIHIRIPGRAARHCRPAPWAWHAVERYIARRPMPRTGAPPHSDVLFVNRDGNPLTARSVRRKLTDYSRRAGLPVEATPAVLRHSCAIHMLLHGADTKTVRDLLGHLSASSMRPYLNRLAGLSKQPAASPEPLKIAVS